MRLLRILCVRLYQSLISCATSALVVTVQAKYYESPLVREKPSPTKVIEQLFDFEVAALSY